MFTKTITVLAMAIVTVSFPFNSFAQRKVIDVNTSVKAVPANSSVESAIEELKSENQILTEKNSELESRLNQIEKDLAQCCMSYKLGGNSLKSGEKNNIEGAKLEQNTPNPFKEKTVIRYYVPSASAEASIKIYSVFGSELLSFPLSSKGFGEIEFSGKTLSAGTFTYILIVDGKAVDTKQMVLTK